MQLERVTAVLRPRSAWEAADLGFMMVRRWWRPVYLFWMIAVLPLFVVLFFLFRNRPVFVVLAIWWAKPLLDRVPLFFLSRALFGEMPTASKFIEQLPKLFTHSFFHALLLQRLQLSRSFTLPVTELEGLRGRVRVKRARTLLSRSGGAARMVTILCWGFEIGIALAMAGLVTFFLPHGLSPDWFKQGALTSGGARLAVLFYFLAMTIVEPLFVAAGFSLYVNRRTRLEGWDIELAFRRLKKRVESRQIAKKSLVALSIWIGVLVPVSFVGAMEPEPGPVPERVIEQVLDHSDFQPTRTEKKFRWRSATSHEMEGNPVNGRLLARLLEPLLWVASAILFVFLVWWTSRWFAGWKGWEPRATTSRRPETVLGLDIRPESLPTDIPGAALQLLANGDVISAISLLYRGTLARLVHGDGLALKASNTEGDCLRLAQSTLTGAKFDYLSSLTDTWVRAAYGHEDPRAEGLRQLCSRWTVVFGERA